jgi:hypothetical protein
MKRELLELAHVDQTGVRLAQDGADRRRLRVLGPLQGEVQEGGGLPVEDERGYHADGEDAEDAEEGDAEVVEVFQERHLAPGLGTTDRRRKAWRGFSPCGGGP